MPKVRPGGKRPIKSQRVVKKKKIDTNGLTIEDLRELLYKELGV